MDLQIVLPKKFSLRFVKRTLISVTDCRSTCEKTRWSLLTLGRMHTLGCFSPEFSSV